jgi:hypothetical protein
VFRFALLVGAGLLAACSAPRVQAEVGIGALDIGGEVSTSASSGNASLSASSDADSLGLGREAVLLTAVRADWEDWHLTLAGLGADYSGNGTAQGRLQVGDQVIRSGEPVRTDLGFGLLTFDAYYDIVPVEFMDIGVGAGIGLLDYDLDFESSRTGARVRAAGNLPIGYIGLRLGKEWERLALLGRVNGFAISLEAEDVSFFEADLRGSYLVIGQPGGLSAAVAIGWRYLRADYEPTGSGFRLEIQGLTLNGPYAGIAIVF